MISKKQKQYCINNLVSIIVEMLLEESTNIDESEIMYRFTSSKTYELLNDFETGLWREGPDYIMALYKKEIIT